MDSSEVDLDVPDVTSEVPPRISQAVDARVSQILRQGPVGNGQPVHIGRYRVCFEIASGGMATLYMARATGSQGFGKVVALKRIHPHLAGQMSFVKMFLDEARIASRISHPNVCSVFDFGESDGVYYLAMEYLAGEALGRVLTRTAKSPENKADPRVPLLGAFAVSQAAEGLHAAHDLRGDDGNPLEVVHRDVCPQNLFVTYDGTVSVLDFGIAHAEDRIHQTVGQVVKGKFSYMAPEQLLGHKLDRRADVWSLGVCLWEALTLKRLFRKASHAETMRAVLDDVIPAPSSVNPQVPPAFDAIVLRALERDRDKRYATARDLGRELIAALRATGQPVGAIELGEWMDKIFPGDRARKAQLVELARQIDESVPKLGTASIPPTSGSGASDSKSLAPYERDSMRTGATSNSAKKPPVLAIGALLFLGVTIGAAIALQGRDGARTDVPSGASERVPAAAPRPPAPPAIAPTPAPVVVPAASVALAAPVADTSTTTLAIAEPNVANTVPSEVLAPAPSDPRADEERDGSRRRGPRSIALRAGSPQPTAPATVDQVIAAPSAVEAAPPPPAPAPVVVAATPPAPAPRPAAAPPAPAPAPRPASFDARTTLEGVTVNGALSTNSVSQAISRSLGPVRECYRAASRRAGADRAVSLAVSLRIDEMGRARPPEVGSAPLPGLSQCVGDALMRVRTTQRPDTGHAVATFRVRFDPL